MSTCPVSSSVSRCALGAWTQVDVLLLGAELLGDVVRDVDVEARVLVALLEAEAGLVELDADLDLLAGRGHRTTTNPPALFEPPQAARPRVRAAVAAIAAPIRRAVMCVSSRW
jgi:hypothetical protein